MQETLAEDPEALQSLLEQTLPARRRAVVIDKAGIRQLKTRFRPLFCETEVRFFILKIAFPSLSSLC